MEMIMMAVHLTLMMIVAEDMIIMILTVEVAIVNAMVLMILTAMKNKIEEI